MFDRALVAMDFSPATDALVSALPGLREFGTEAISLIHVAKPMEYPVSESITKADDLRKRLRTLAEGLEEHGFDVSVDVRSGSAASEIVQAAGERSVDFIVVGSRSRSRIGEAFVGSVAWEVLRRAERPVFFQRIDPVRAEPEAALEARGAGLPSRVVYPSDFSETAERAVPWVRWLAELGTAEFVLLHGTPESDEEGRTEARNRFETLAETLKGAGAEEVTIDVRDADASDLVLSHWGRDPDAMVVMGTHGRGFLPEVVLGSESRRVVRRASSRVFLVPATGK